ncbi:DsbA family protein [Acidiphilium sp.]|uniref:DsbA family protein n=1 Tax=Acidiphilium sp. TaxID=527 RepID=UPI003D01378F
MKLRMDRRSLLRLIGGLGMATGLGGVTSAVAEGAIAPPTTDGAFGVRSLGKSTAPVTVYEYYSMNCPHCAFFGIKVLPEIIHNFVNTGKIYYVFKDFPLNEDAVMAAQVARSLPAHEYLAFISELFRTQDQWAFASNLKTKQDYENALFRYAALAGMDRQAFDAALANKKLEKFILSELKVGEDKYHIDATPSFVINGRKREGAVDFKQFSRWIDEA